jgi:alpha-N-acetylglucosamine transferase
LALQASQSMALHCYMAPCNLVLFRYALASETRKWKNLPSDSQKLSRYVELYEELICLGGHPIVNEAVVNEKEVYATFLSTRVGGNASSGEMEYDWYFNSTRVLIHRLLRNESTRGHRNVIVTAS